MSRSDGNTFGLEHGKIGDRIAVVLNGRQIYKKLYSPTNPRTPKQQMHRAKLAFINRLSAVLADAVNLGFAKVPEPKSMQSPRNAFVKANWDKGALIWNQETSAWELCYERLLLAQGPRFISPQMTARVSEGRLRITCSDLGLNDKYAVADDQLYVAIYRPDTSALHLYRGPLRAECAECTFALPPDDGDADGMMRVYAWFQATCFHRATSTHATVRPNQASPSLYLGAFVE